MIEYLSKPACAQCDASERGMARRGIRPDKRRDMSQDSAALQLAIDLGHRQAPVTIVRESDGTIIDHWSGFRPDKIMELARAAATQVQSNAASQNPTVGTSPPDLAPAI
ncbi:glutaredoxin-like protein NrdH [Rarobacter faecitabidus]|uniref:Glutaredoxin-like protein NrdH n=1 Tax=Rarobacter faecitabidus TaxID=13243 RepID=A0A542ZAW4_RARFA|nr:NrdH-redoxin [Rarobacter faecitabidus]TQL57431.1 glutaredoxin-like protein NrdH [Rarobacter faecitabidus]